MQFSTYEHDEARKIAEYRKARSKTEASRVGAAVARVADGAQRRIRQIPGADQALQLAEKAYLAAMDGISKALTTSTALTLGPRRLWRRYERHGHPIAAWRDIHALDLEIVDRVRPPSLRHVYALGGGVEGAMGGFLMGGGAVLAGGGALAGGGVGAAPGAGVAAGVFVADTASTLVASTRLILQTGSYYGYDPKDEVERLFAAAVMSYGTAATATAKNAAFADLFRLANMLARNKPWVELNKAFLTRLVGPVFERLALRLTKMKLGQIAPGVGIAIGFGMNYKLLDNLGAAAHWAYRERFLRDKGYPFDDREPDVEWGGEDDETTISIIQLAEEEGIDLPDSEDR